MIAVWISDDLQRCDRSPGKRSYKTAVQDQGAPVQTGREGDPICSAIAEKWIVDGLNADRAERKAQRIGFREAFEDRRKPLAAFPALVQRQSEVGNLAALEGSLEEDVKRDFERVWNLEFTVLDLNCTIGNKSFRQWFVKHLVERLTRWGNDPPCAQYFLLTLDRIQANGQGHVVVRTTAGVLSDVSVFEVPSNR